MRTWGARVQCAKSTAGKKRNSSFWFCDQGERGAGATPDPAFQLPPGPTLAVSPPALFSTRPNAPRAPKPHGRPQVSQVRRCRRDERREGGA